MEICSVRVGQGMYGIPITHILEIVGEAKPQRVPLAPGFIGGMVHYRGDVLTTVVAEMHKVLTPDGVLFRGSSEPGRYGRRCWRAERATLSRGW